MVSAIRSVPLKAENIDVLKKDTTLGSLNSSSHVPVSIDLHHGALKKAPSSRPIPAQACKLKWDKGDIQKYKDTVKEELDAYPLDLLDIDGKLDMAASILNTAALTAIPGVTSKPPKGPRKPWTPALADAEKLLMQ